MVLNGTSAEFRKRLEAQAAKVREAKTGADAKRAFNEFGKLILDFYERFTPDLAAKGDHDGIRETLAIASYAIQAGIPLPPKMSTFIANGLEDIANGNSHGAPFGLKYKRGQRADTRQVRARHQKWTELVEAARNSSPEKGKKRITIEDAIAMVAKQVGVSDEAIRSAWKEKRKASRALKAEIERVRNSR